MRTVAYVPEHDEFLDAIDDQHDRREAWTAIVITAIALGVVLIASLLLVVSAARG
jgi:hypothetical protein